MPRTLENPDRNFSTDGEPALPYNEAAKARIGKVIGNAVLPSRIRKPLRVL
jgi:hypothetical protein